MASDSFVGEGLTPTPYKIALARAKLAEAAFDDVMNECGRLHADLGDPQFWVDRRVACISGGYPPSEAKYVSLQEYVLAIELERDKAFETWRELHVATLNAFIKNEHEPLQKQNEMLRAQVQAYREDLHREVDAHCVTIETLNKRDDQLKREEALALKYRDDANRNESMLKRSEAECHAVRIRLEGAYIQNSVLCSENEQLRVLLREARDCLSACTCARWPLIADIDAALAGEDDGVCGRCGGVGCPSCDARALAQGEKM